MSSARLCSRLKSVGSKPATPAVLPVMQQEKQCVDRASSTLAFKRCLKQTRQSRSALREQYYAYINPIRQQLGLPALEWVERR